MDAVKAETDLAIHCKDIFFAYPVNGRDIKHLSNQKRNSKIGGKLSFLGKKVYIDAVNGLNLKVPAGHRTGIIGHNGAGKSTLLRLIAGIFEPDSGYVKTMGTICSGFNLMIGMAPALSGLENIHIKMKLHGIKKNEIQKKVDDIIEFSELEDFIALPIRTYSAGMQARLAFSIITSLDADILLLDEWMGAGDQQFREKAQIRMQSFYEKARTVVMVSHNRPLIEKNCDTIYEMKKGLLEKIY
jgi:lipopolysaccharide transport system ATP-binding protein